MQRVAKMSSVINAFPDHLEEIGEVFIKLKELWSEIGVPEDEQNHKILHLKVSVVWAELNLF